VPDQVVSGGQIHLVTPARSVQAGLPFTHVIEPLPPSNISDVGAARAVRLVEATFRLRDTGALSLDTGRGLKDISLRRIGAGDTILDAPPPLVTGDIRVCAYGWKNDTSKPLWRIEQSQPLPFALLSVQTDIIAN